MRSAGQQRAERFAAEFENRPPIVCERHGERDPREQTCWACLHEENQAQVDRENAERQARRIEGWHAALARAMGPRHAPASLAQFRCESQAQQAALAGCKAFAEDMESAAKGKGLLLIGRPGTGKTTLAGGIGHAWIDADASPVAYATQRDLIREVRATWRKDADETEEEVIRRYGTASLLLLDDAGVGPGSDAELVTLLDVVDMRYCRKLPTVVASNLSLPMLKEALGDRVYDRLREDARVVACNWASFRGLRDVATGGGAA